MKPLYLLLAHFTLFYPLIGSAKILPEVFYLSPGSQAELCSSKRNSADFWFTIMSSHIDKLLNQTELNDFDHDVLKNQLVTQSYLELSLRSHGQENSMTYVYANASHHLGRLVRYHYWERYPKEAIGQEDRSYISGEILGTVVRTVPRLLAKTLMNHSLFLYKTLSWSLGASVICGQDAVDQMLQTTTSKKVLDEIFPHFPSRKQKELMKRLRKAFTATTPEQFISSFVAFEQTYLQYTMYASPEVSLPSSLGLLDKMRFIPFNGERSLSYYDWCKARKCRQTSFNLEHRILFDQTVILKEINLTKNDHRIMDERIQKTHLNEVSDFILNNLIPGRMKEDFTTVSIQNISNFPQ